MEIQADAHGIRYIEARCRGMRSFRAKPTGWRYHSYEHSLAAHGVKSKPEQVAEILMRPDAGFVKTAVSKSEDEPAVVKVLKNPLEGMSVMDVLPRSALEREDAQHTANDTQSEPEDAQYFSRKSQEELDDEKKDFENDLVKYKRESKELLENNPNGLNAGQAGNDLRAWTALREKGIKAGILRREDDFDPEFFEVDK